MPTSFDIESSVISKNAAVKSKGWELNTGIICPVGSFLGATDHFSFDLHVPGTVNHPGGTTMTVSGDGQFHPYFGNTILACTVTLVPGKYAGTFSLNRSGENTVIFGTEVVPDFAGLAVWLEPIGDVTDYGFGLAGGSPVPVPWPWPCFQNQDSVDFTDPDPVPTNSRSWANNACPDPVGLTIDCLGGNRWPDSGGYQWLSGEDFSTSNRFRYRCPFRIWVTGVGDGNLVGSGGENDLDFHLDGHLLRT
jgi:hypothetical protein